ncbi:alpha-L-fucosidase [Enterococcus innesii]|uniref:alpha-L-fucosidase n=1 Tax=Enterococcus innesii TaxID=2839759 RepID=UPI0022B96082|nr:alpha-L-fucosidase [Enterococcus innesii]
MKIREDIVENKVSEDESYGVLSPIIKEKIEWFKNQKLGVIFHWGLYAEAGIVESWQLSKEDNWARRKGAWRENLEDLRRDYWSLIQTFNPQKFDPKSWAILSKQAGFKYMLFTSKHHDGFAMYDTKYSSYKITSQQAKFHTNSKADILAHVNEAFREEGLSVGTYYSKPDWHCPYYWEPNSDPIGRYASYDPLKKPKTWQQFNKFVDDQLTEIVTNYGPIDILWLDGGWVNRDNNEILDMPTIVNHIRNVQSDVLIVDRTIGGPYEDYVTPERKVPKNIPRKAWETNIPLAKNWGYVPNDVYKTFEEIIDTFIEVVALGGNLILGVGPKPDGTLPEEAVELMSKLGEWIAMYGDGIFDTRPVENWNIKNCFLTAKDNKLFIFYKNTYGLQNISLKACPKRIRKAILVNTGKEVDIQEDTLILPEPKERYGCVKLLLEEN